ncbi:hypothetical protein [Algoriphagus boritolerans]|uniref:Tetratricopeptide repeat-containing protein n=1 Tax=Algoriphagus boritolerans DSM 17298 = JCM 18970 TaxID=1120964 RepID=A0A1H5XF04_9BACT|nr:hypothetical protein [Algoriphagus boritolerans]SEG10010.1 hypothetical protein SAMN03080598_02479 [Algoriphagus boritolerans DSM 17298 = JCM 18970]
MNATQFLELIQKADHLEKSDILLLKKVQENFPYFQIPHVLTARYEFLKSEGTESHFLAQAAVTSPDRIWLKKLIEKPIPEGFKPDPAKEDLLPEDPEKEHNPASRTASLKNLGMQLKGQVTPEEPPKPEKPAAKRRKPPKDDLIETIKRKEKREIVDSKKQEQIDMIKAFSKKEFKLATIKEIEANQNTENLAESSTKLNSNLLSESFARILIQQGKKTMAKEIYEKLALKFPEKRTYFADLIEKLKE